MEKSDIEKTIDQIIAVVSAAATALGPAAPIAQLVIGVIRALVSFAEQLGHGDAVREGLDAELAAGRQATDAALAAKHAAPSHPDLIAAAQRLRGTSLDHLGETAAAAVRLLVEHHDPQPVSTEDAP